MQIGFACQDDGERKKNTEEVKWWEMCFLFKITLCQFPLTL